MKRKIENSPILSLYESATQAANSSARRSLRNKLTERDLRRARLSLVRARSQGEQLPLDTVSALINETKQKPHDLDKTTLSRHLSEVGIEYHAGKGDYPENVDLPRWLAKRRGFCDKFKKQPKADVLFGDEAYFGLKKKLHKFEARMHVDGHASFPAAQKHGPQARVTVWGAVGLDWYTPLVVFNSGRCLNADTYKRMMDNTIIPALKQTKKRVTLFEDNYGVHKEQGATLLFSDNEINHQFIPTYSPDLSWIEKVWANLAARVYKGQKVYSNKDALAAALNNEWENLVGDMSYRRRLVRDGEEACKAILDNQGYRVHWS